MNELQIHAVDTDPAVSQSTDVVVLPATDCQSSMSHGFS